MISTVFGLHSIMVTSNLINCDVVTSPLSVNDKANRRIFLCPSEIKQSSNLLTTFFILCILFSPSSGANYYSLMPTISLAPSAANYTIESASFIPTLSPTNSSNFTNASAPVPILTTSFTPTDSPFSTKKPSKKTTPLPAGTLSPVPTRSNSTTQPTGAPTSTSLVPTPSPTTLNPFSPSKPSGKQNQTSTERPSIILTSSPSNKNWTATQTSNPTPSPTRNPTPSPTRNPTRQSQKPTSMPSKEITEKPLPTTQPLPILTSTPTAQPTKTTLPSIRPTAVPTLTLQVSPVISNIVMEFDDCPKLENSSIVVWRDVTARFVNKSMSTNLMYNYGVQFSDLRVKIMFKNQLGPWFRNDTNSTAYGNSRYLQTQLSPLYMFFDVVIKLRSPVQQHDWQSYFIDTLNTKEKLVAYLKELSSSGDDAFGSINNVTVEIDGKSIAKVQQSTDNEGKEPFGGIGLIIVCASAAAAVVAITAIMFIIFRRKRATNKPNDENNRKADKHDAEDDGMYIEVEHATDDVSTLGDMFGSTWQSHQKFDDPTVGESTVKCNTVYQNHLLGNVADSGGKRTFIGKRHSSPNPYSSTNEDDIVISKEGVESSPPFQASSRKKNEGSSLHSATAKPNTSTRRDFETVCYGENTETQIEVNAPPGKLGVIIDADRDGQLKVNSIKSSSPLADLIRVGDILKSVDGESTVGLTAHGASSLISSKADNPRRVLVFIRNAKS